MTHLKDQPSLSAIFHNFSKNKRPLLLLDYDGTLAPFTEDRHHAYPYPGVRERLQTLLKTKISDVIIISGRNVKQIIPLLQLSPHPELWGCHGWEWITPDGKYHHLPLDLEKKEGLEKAFAFSQSTPYEHMIERKPFSIALHWRSEDQTIAESAENLFLDEWDKIALEYSLEIFPFNGGIEIRPIGRNKGDLVSQILRERPQCYPIAYLGDDLTDEQAFSSLGEKGLKVLIKDQPISSLADIRLVPPEQLLEFLDLWIEAEGALA